MLPKGKLLFERSDEVRVRGVLQEGFGNYAGFMYRPVLLAHNKPDPPDFSLQLRNIFANRIHTLLEDDEASLGLGYMVGDKSTMSEKLMESFRIVGLSHLIVTSGFHLSILVNFSKRFLGKVSRITSIVGTTILVLCFMAIAGFGASMARAGLMCLASLYAWYFGRKFHPGRLLLFVAAITLIIEPLNVSNIGWQLSFASFAGIVFLSPILTEFFYGKSKPGYIAASLITSISAQLFCLPISIYNFGMFSAIGVIVSLIITPTVSVAMLLILLTGTVAPFLAIITNLLLKLHLLLISFAANIPWASVNVPSQNKFIFLAYIPILMILIVLKRLTKYDFRPRYALDKS